MRLETDRLILRHWRDEDAAAMFEYTSDPEIGLMCGWVPYRCIEGCRLFIYRTQIKEECYCICLKEEPAWMTAS